MKCWQSILRRWQGKNCRGNQNRGGLSSTRRWLEATDLSIQQISLEPKNNGVVDAGPKRQELMNKRGPFRLRRRHPRVYHAGYQMEQPTPHTSRTQLSSLVDLSLSGSMMFLKGGRVEKCSQGTGNSSQTRRVISSPLLLLAHGTQGHPSQQSWRNHPPTTYIRPSRESWTISHHLTSSNKGFCETKTPSSWRILSARRCLRGSPGKEDNVSLTQPFSNAVLHNPWNWEGHPLNTRTAPKPDPDSHLVDDAFKGVVTGLSGHRPVSCV